jgi:hypothetical protein
MNWRRLAALLVEIDPERDDDEAVPGLRVDGTVRRLIARGWTQQGRMGAGHLPDGRCEVSFMLAPPGWEWRPPGEAGEERNDG